MSDEKLKALSADYHESLPEKAEQLKVYLRAIEEGGFVGADVFALTEYVHKLVGSIGMYGYAKLAQRAESVDQLLNVTEDGRDDAWRTEVRRELSQFIDCVDACYSRGRIAARQ